MWVNSALEISVSRQNAGHNEVILEKKSYLRKSQKKTTIYLPNKRYMYFRKNERVNFSKFRLFKSNLLDNFRYVVIQRSGISDASLTSIAGNVEAQLLEVRKQTRGLQVFRHDSRAGRQGGLHERLYVQPQFDSLENSSF